MATVTPNFNWPVPTSTDLVKDGATAIEALGDSIDASLVDLKGGTTGQVLSKNSDTDMDFVWVTDAAGDITGVTAGTGISGGGTSGTVTVTNSMATAIDAKGDLIAGTAADTFSRIAVGTNGQVLTADSTAATGLAWATPGGMTLLSTTTLTGASLTISSISQSYTDLVGIIVGAYSTNTGSGTYIRINSDSSALYNIAGNRNIGSTLSSVGSFNNGQFQVSPRSATTNTDSKKTYVKFEIPRYTQTEPKLILNRCYSSDDTDVVSLQNVGNYTGTSAVTSLNIFSDYTFSGGTLYLYGVK